VATGVHRQESNREKNRTTHPQTADIDSGATLPAIMQPGYDAERWSEARGASIVGYVVEVKRGSRETVNCEATARAFMDTHIALVADSTDISEAARTDAELARAHFGPVDLGMLIEQLVQSWETRREVGNARIAYARPRKDSAVVMGKSDRLARALNAILDNAISFSPPNGLIEIAVSRVGDDVRIRIDDEGPGVPAEARDAIFNRFHSVRPDTENFGRHSGLGLAIAQAIVNGHDGEIDVQDRDDAPSGARFTIRLPAALSE